MLVAGVAFTSLIACGVAAVGSGVPAADYRAGVSPGGDP